MKWLSIVPVLLLMACSQNNMNSNNPSVLHVDSLSGEGHNQDSLVQVPTEEQAVQKASVSLMETKWILFELNGKKPGRTQVPPHIIMNEIGNSVSGNAGCNSYGGSFTLKEENGISFSPMFATKMGCNLGMDIENEFLGIFTMINLYKISADTLSFHYENINPLARFVAQK